MLMYRDLLFTSGTVMTIHIPLFRCANYSQIELLNGIFQFNRTDLESVVSQMARWYDIEVEYKGIPSKENRFTGKIPMSVNLSRLLKWMEWSDVHFKLKGNKLTVIP